MAQTQITGYDVIYSSNAFSRRIGLLNGGKFFGQLVFMADGSTLPADGMIGNQVSLYYNGPGNENGITTGAENVGP
jgi:hypothetical protein